MNAVAIMPVHVWEDNNGETEASLSLGVRMDTWNAELSHCPNALITESSKPHSAAVVAAPIRNCDLHIVLAVQSETSICLSNLSHKPVPGEDL